MLRRYGAIVALGASALIACNSAQTAPQGGQGMPPTAVQLAEATPRPIEDASEYVATLKSLNATAIQPQVDGQVTQIFVKSGDRVQRGAPLVQIDPRRQQAAVSSQEADVAAKEASVTFARQHAQRSAELFKAGAISRQELEQAETAQRTAEADLKSLQAQVQQLEVQLRYFTISAPADGVIGDVPVRVGNQVTPQTMLTTIDQNRALEVYVSVPADRASALRLGLPLQVLSSASEKLATSTVSFISPRVDEQTQTLLVKGQVQNPNTTLRAQQFVRARIVWKTADGLTIPVTAVARINGAYFGFVAETQDGKLVARQRALKLGPIVDDGYTILSGIKPGERMVVSGAQKLVDGAPIAAGPATPTS